MEELIKKCNVLREVELINNEQFLINPKDIELLCNYVDLITLMSDEKFRIMYDDMHDLYIFSIKDRCSCSNFAISKTNIFVFYKEFIGFPIIKKLKINNSLKEMLDFQLANFDSKSKTCDCRIVSYKKMLIFRKGEDSKWKKF